MGLQAVRNLNIDFHDTKYISINAKQYDRFSRFILVTCCTHGVTLSIDKNNNYAFVRYRKPDELGVFNSCEITNEGKILVELSEQMLAVVGQSYADLVIVHNESTDGIDVDKNTGELIIDNNSSILSTMHFYVNVIEDSFKNTEIESSYEYNALNDLLIKATTDYTYVINTTKSLAENVKISENNAKQYEINASMSESNAKTYAENAKLSEVNAKESETNAKESETNAKESEVNAKESEVNAKESEVNAKESEINAKESEINANNSEQIATEKATAASQSASDAAESANIATEKATETSDNVALSKSYAVGGTGVRIDEDIDNSKYYYSQIKTINDSMGGSFLPMGTIEFSELQSVKKYTGYVYHIKNSFVTDDTFKCGAGITYPIGTNVYYTSDGYWDCFVGETLTVADDGDGNVKIEGNYDFITTYDEFNDLNNLIAELKERIKILEEQAVLGITE